MEILKTSEIVARKSHVCDFCGGQIKKDEKYSNQRNKNSGTVYTWKSHLQCVAISQELKMYEGACDGVNAEMFAEHIMDRFDQINNDKPLGQIKALHSLKFKDKLDFVIKTDLQS